MLLDGKTIAVIGGNGLIGKEVVTGIVQHGGTVISGSRSGKIETPSADRNSDTELNKVDAISLNVNSPESVDQFFKEILKRYGQCNGVINLSFPRNELFGAKFENVTYASFLENVGDHMGGAFLVCQKALSILPPANLSSIINCSSIYGFMTPQFDLYKDTSMTKEIEYVTAKAAIIQMTRYLAQYFKGKGVRINCISPGGIFDNQPESFVEKYNARCNSKGMLDGQDIVGAIVFLLSDLSTHLTGQNIVIDDGFSL